MAVRYLSLLLRPHWQKEGNGSQELIIVSSVQQAHMVSPSLHVNKLPSNCLLISLQNTHTHTHTHTHTDTHTLGGSCWEVKYLRYCNKSPKWGDQAISIWPCTVLLTPVHNLVHSCNKGDVFLFRGKDRAVEAMWQTCRPGTHLHRVMSGKSVGSRTIWWLAQRETYGQCEAFRGLMLEWVCSISKREQADPWQERDRPACVPRNSSASISWNHFSINI